MSLERRGAHRITYPDEARPIFDLDGAPQPVADVSEHGLRFAAPASASIALGDDVEGIVRFRSGAELRVAGTVIRIADGWAAVRLAERLPLAALLAEQRFVRTRYPGWGREEE